MIEQVSSPTLADGVESSILNLIRRRTLKPGDLLPKEDEIAGELNVSRICVREGLGRLKALGLVEPRKRRGTALCRPNPFVQFGKIAGTNLFPDADRIDFMEMRVALELGMSELIFMRRTPAAVRELRRIAGSLADTSSEVEFHTALMAVSGNRNAREFRNVLAEFFKFPEAFSEEVCLASRQEHLHLCDVLENGTATEFHEAMRVHFRPYFKYFARNTGNGDAEQLVPKTKEVSSEKNRKGK